MPEETHRQPREATSGPPPDAGEFPTFTSEERDEARKRLVARQGLAADVVAYVVVNSFLVVVWALAGGGYFWPAWVMAAWGIGLIMHVWDTYFRRVITEADVDEELRRRR